MEFRIEFDEDVLGERAVRLRQNRDASHQESNPAAAEDDKGLISEDGDDQGTYPSSSSWSRPHHDSFTLNSSGARSGHGGGTRRLRRIMEEASRRGAQEVPDGPDWHPTVNDQQVWRSMSSSQERNTTLTMTPTAFHEQVPVSTTYDSSIVPPISSARRYRQSTSQHEGSSQRRSSHTSESNGEDTTSQQLSAVFASSSASARAGREGLAMSNSGSVRQIGSRDGSQSNILSMTPTALSRETSRSQSQQTTITMSQQTPPPLMYRIRTFVSKQQQQQNQIRNQGQQRRRDSIDKKRLPDAKHGGGKIKQQSQNHQQPNDQQVINPGAFAVQGMGGSDLPPQMPFGTVNTSSDPNLMSCATIDLPHALPTGNDSMNATPFCTPESSSRNRFLIPAMILCLIIVIIVAAVVVTLVANGSNDNGNELSHNGGLLDDPAIRSQVLRAMLEESLYASDKEEGDASINRGGFALFDNTTSPQYKALDFLAKENYYEILPLRMPSSLRMEGTLQREEVADEEQISRLIQRYVLAVLYFSMYDDISGWKESFLFTVPIHECDWTSSQSSSATFSTEDDDQRRGVICDTIDIEDRQRRVVTGIVMSKFLKPTNKLAGRRQRRGRKPITQEKPVTPESDVLSQNTSFLCIIETFTYQMTTTLLELYQRKLVN